jgi:hypothetical protein
VPGKLEASDLSDGKALMTVSDAERLIERQVVSVLLGLICLLGDALKWQAP